MPRRRTKKNRMTRLAAKRAAHEKLAEAVANADESVKIPSAAPSRYGAKMEAAEKELLAAEKDAQAKKA